MNTNLTDAQKLLEARIDDLVEKADRGELVCGNFLTPAEAAFCMSAVRSRGLIQKAFLFGGYAEAERKRLYILPSYLDGMSQSPDNVAEEYLSRDLEESICAIRICGSGYRTLSHRDYLGSLLSLGIERHSLGDVVILGDFEAVIFCTSSICKHIAGSLERVASDKVRVSRFAVRSDFAPKREFISISDTVASDRLDCIVSAITNMSREKAQTAIRSGLCELDYITTDQCDRRVEAPCIISVRGYGKYRLIKFDGETKRGRLRLVAEKYV